MKFDTINCSLDDVFTIRAKLVSIERVKNGNPNFILGFDQVLSKTRKGKIFYVHTADDYMVNYSIDSYCLGGLFDVSAFYVEDKDVKKFISRRSIVDAQEKPCEFVLSTLNRLN